MVQSGVCPRNAQHAGGKHSAADFLLAAPRSGANSVTPTGDAAQALRAPHHCSGEGSRGLDEVTRAARERAEEKIHEDDQPLQNNVVESASRRR